MKAVWPAPLTRTLTVALALATAVSVMTLFWLGRRAVAGWQHSARSLAERRARETVDLLTRALVRDMRGAQARILTSPHWEDFRAEPSHAVVNLVASAFARYPYPESFFAWRNADGKAPVVLFARSDRRPSWLAEPRNNGRFP